jgi:hypothetical protein
LEVKWLWVQEKVIDRLILLKKHGTETNVADLGTKYLAKPRMDMLLGLLAMTLVREAEASTLAVATTSARGSGCLSACVTLLFCAVAAVGFWLQRSAPTTAPKAAVAPTKATLGTAPKAALETTPRGRSRLGETRRFLESLDGGELRMLLRARRLETGGSAQTLIDRLAAHAATVGQDERLKFMTVDELKALLRRRGLRVGGLKQELCDRLLQ